MTYLRKEHVFLQQQQQQQQQQEEDEKQNHFKVRMQQRLPKYFNDGTIILIIIMIHLVTLNNNSFHCYVVIGCCSVVTTNSFQMAAAFQQQQQYKKRMVMKYDSTTTTSFWNGLREQQQNQQKQQQYIGCYDSTKFTKKNKNKKSFLQHRTLVLNVASIHVESIDNNHEVVGQQMASSIVQWLDTEWMPQQVHIDMAEQCRKTYIESRIKGESDLMTIMTNIANDLNEQWYEKYHADAFVNAWDIANYVSDYLTSLTRTEDDDTCQCSSKIY